MTLTCNPFDSLHPASNQPWSLEQWANFATAAGGLLGLVAALIALMTLITGARTARLQHMHDLFKEYLRLQFDYNVAVGEDNGNLTRLRSNLGGFKMYTLEEMTLWLKRERGLRPFYFWSRFHQQHIESWSKTIDWHLDTSSPEDFSDFEKARACYGPDFIVAVDRSKARVKAKLDAYTPRDDMDT
jgi:hypothetical protein